MASTDFLFRNFLVEVKFVLSSLMVGNSDELLIEKVCQWMNEYHANILKVKFSCENPRSFSKTMSYLHKAAKKLDGLLR